jgi:hypothetical protein
VSPFPEKKPLQTLLEIYILWSWKLEMSRSNLDRAHTASRMKYIFPTSVSRSKSPGCQVGGCN